MSAVNVEESAGGARAVPRDARHGRMRAAGIALAASMVWALADAAAALPAPAAPVAPAVQPPAAAAPDAAPGDRFDSARASDEESVRALTADGRLLMGRDRVKLDGYAYCSMSVAASERGDFRVAIEAAARMLVLAEDTGNANLRALADRDLAVAYSYAGDLIDAKRYALKALDGDASDKAQVLAPANKVLGDVALREGDPQGAIASYRASLDTASARYRPLVLASLASAQIAAGDTAGARASLDASRGAPVPSLAPLFRRIEGNLLLAEHAPQKALDVFAADLDGHAGDAGDDANADSSYNRLWAHEGMARAYLAMGDTARGRAALADALTDSESMRARFRSDEFRTGLFADVQNVFDQAISLAIDEQDYPRAWQLAEQSRARALLDTVRSRVDTGVDTRQLNGAPVTLDQVRATLRENEAIVEYHLLEHRAVVFVVRRDGLTTRVLPVERRELGGALDAFRVAIVTRSADAAPYGARLDHLLIEPLGLKDGERVIIVPHRVLNYMPFQALRNGDGYLIQRHAFALAPSAGVAVQLVTREHAVSSHLIAFGNPLITPHWDLPGAEREVNAITPYFRQSAAWLLSDATIARFRDSAPDGRVLHVATHAQADSVDPLYSRILLAPARQPADGPDFLNARDIYNLKLDGVALVTLSACDTALGRVDRGNEIMGLPRAFFYAGASSVIVSMWKVNDDSTALTMRTFYESLSKGREAIDAMRDAQLAVLAQPGFEHPYYWAPFDLTGGWRLTVAR
ncbi:CHAT domain-containing protein [Caballeronia sp. BR00000012568055]|uniref:CHAT domain-containing protein n=1 Tax=Caballeronia sp. BR00000012568055 TaxID=2918761 RepID=UPI0023F718C3|nr:CHAT domain-containing protein [Caballeronia sp. BR00000012568055]